MACGRVVETGFGPIRSPADYPPEEHMGMLARDYIPSSYRHLNMLRLFLPARDENERPRYWAELLYEGEELNGSSDWNELYSRLAHDRPGEDRPRAAMGMLDTARATAFKELLFPTLGAENEILTKTWSGYAPDNAGPDSTFFGEQEYQHETLTLREVLQRAAHDRIPDFGHDFAGRFAWGSNLYPDSLVIAADPDIFRAFFTDPRLEVASIVRHRDFLPASSGD